MGQLYKNVNDYKNALMFYEKSYMIAKDSKGDDSVAVGDIYINLG